MFSRWGEFAYQHRRVIPLVVVAVIILLYLTFGMRLSDRMSQEGWDDPNSDSTTAAAIEARTFGRDIMVTSSCCLLPKPAPLTSHQSLGTSRNT